MEKNRRLKKASFSQKKSFALYGYEYHFFAVIGDNVRIVGKLMRQTGQFQIIKMSKNVYAETSLINRLIAISNFELSQLFLN